MLCQSGFDLRNNFNSYVLTSNVGNSQVVNIQIVVDSQIVNSQIVGNTGSRIGYCDNY